MLFSPQDSAQWRQGILGVAAGIILAVVILIFFFEIMSVLLIIISGVVALIFIGGAIWLIIEFPLEALVGAAILGLTFLLSILVDQTDYLKKQIVSNLALASTALKTKPALSIIKSRKASLAQVEYLLATLRPAITNKQIVAKQSIVTARKQKVMLIVEEQTRLNIELARRKQTEKDVLASRKLREEEELALRARLSAKESLKAKSTELVEKISENCKEFLELELIFIELDDTPVEEALTCSLSVNNKDGDPLAWVNLKVTPWISQGITMYFGSANKPNSTELSEWSIVRSIRKEVIRYVKTQPL